MYGIFERDGMGRKVRAFASREFADIQAALDFFYNGFTVLDYEISVDGEACDLAVSVGKSLSVYAIEKVA